MKKRLIFFVVVFLFSLKLNAQSMQYIYDKVGRLTKVIYPNTFSISYYYDKDGNRLTKLIDKVKNLNTVPSISEILCAGRVKAVAYTATNAYKNGNTFTAQLSDSNGSFSKPINIGSISKTTSDTIKATIPKNTLSGTKYRIRVISSNPLDTSYDNGSDITISAKPATSSISGNNTTFINSTEGYSVTNKTGSSFQWFVKNGSITNGNGTNSINVKWVGVQTTGVLKVVEANKNGCVGDTVFLNVSIKAYSLSVNPTNLYFTYNGSPQQINVSSNTDWSVIKDKSWIMVNPTFGNSNDNIVITVTENPLTVDRYATVTISTGIIDKTVQITQYGKTTKIDLNKSNNEINIFPNPSNGKFTIDFNGQAKSKKIQIFDFTGKMLKEIKTNEREIQIDIGEFGKGIYTISILTEKLSINSKLIVQ